jgi:HEAT repeat protein
VEALGRLTDESALPALLRLMEQDVWIRPAVVQTLGNIGRSEAVPALVSALDDKNDTTRVGALEALIKIVVEPHAEGGRLPAAGERTDLPAAPLLRELRTAAPPGNAYAAHLLGWLGQPAALPDLVAALGAGDANLRHAASEALLRFGPTAVPALREALQASNAQTRESAAELLGFLADAAVVVDLARGLLDPDVAVRQAVVRALGSIGGDQAWEALLRSLEDADVADTALGVLGQQRDASLISQLQRYLYEGQSSTRWAAARALSLFGDETAVSILLNAIRLPDDAIRRPAAEALARVRGSRAVSVLIEALGDRDALVRQQAVEALGSIPDSRAVAALLPLAEDGEWRVRRALVNALIHIGDTRIYPPLDLLARDLDRWVRRAVMDGCAMLADARASEILVTGLEDPDPEVLCAALIALGRRRDLAAAAAVAGQLTHSLPMARAIAISALARIGGPLAVERLPLLVHDASDAVRHQLADTLGEMGSDDVIEALEVLLRDESEAVRARGAEGLRHIGTLRAAEALANALSEALCQPVAQAQLALLGDLAVRALLTTARSAEAGLRLAAAETLGQLRSQQAAPTLRILLKDPDARVRLAADAALKVIAGS